MKPLLILFLGLTLFGCKLHPRHYYMPGYDFKLFSHTPAAALADAVEADDTARVRAAIHANKANLDFQDPKFGNTLLTLAVMDFKYLAAKVLLDSGANPNLRSGEYGRTPFLTTCLFILNQKQRIELLDEMIRHGANVNDSEIPTDSTGRDVDTLERTALVYSIESMSLETVKLLVDHGAKLDIYPKDGSRSLVRHAAPRLDILRYLLIEKNIPIPDYVVIRNEGNPTEKKLSLRELLLEDADRDDPSDAKLRKEILDWLASKGK